MSSGDFLTIVAVSCVAVTVCLICGMGFYSVFDGIRELKRRAGRKWHQFTFGSLLFFAAASTIPLALVAQHLNYERSRIFIAADEEYLRTKDREFMQEFRYEITSRNAFVVEVIHEVSFRNLATPELKRASKSGPRRQCALVRCRPGTDGFAATIRIHCSEKELAVFDALENGRPPVLFRSIAPLHERQKFDIRGDSMGYRAELRRGVKYDLSTIVAYVELPEDVLGTAARYNRVFITAYTPR